MRMIAVVAALMVVAFVSTPAQAAVIHPVASLASEATGYTGPPYGLYRDPNLTIDGSGMTPGMPAAGPPNTTVTLASTLDNAGNGTGWQDYSSGVVFFGIDPLYVPGPTWIVYDLGASYTVTGFHLWNYGYPQGSPSDRGVKDMNAHAPSSLSAYPTGWGSSLQSFTSITQSDGTATDPGANYTFTSSISGQYIGFHLTANWGSGFANGFDEIRFVTANGNEAAVPEPSTFVLAGLALVGLGFVALRKKYRRA